MSSQRKIVAVLTAYDDLIENNTRRVQILEEMAQALYREWFVHFRFPGHERSRMVESERGKIPEGWTVTRVGEQFKVVLGGTPSRDNPLFWQGGDLPWINSGKVNNLRVISASEFITKLGLARSSAKMMPQRTTLIAITGATLGQVSQTEMEVCANQSVVGVFDEHHNLSEFLYLTFCQNIHAIIQHASGGAQQHINKEIVSETQFLLLKSEIARRFQTIVGPLFDNLVILLRKNENLKQTRDLLLPKLISGGVAVDDLEIGMGD